MQFKLAKCEVSIQLIGRNYCLNLEMANAN